MDWARLRGFYPKFVEAQCEEHNEIFEAELLPLRHRSKSHTSHMQLQLHTQLQSTSPSV